MMKRQQNIPCNVPIQSLYIRSQKNNSFLELPSATSINSVLNEENEEHRFGIKGYPAVFICLPWKLLFSSTKQLDIRHLKYIYIVY